MYWGYIPEHPPTRMQKPKYSSFVLGFHHLHGRKTTRLMSGRAHQLPDASRTKSVVTTRLSSLEGARPPKNMSRKHALISLSGLAKVEGLIQIPACTGLGA